jgi:hypothetical protein
MSRRHGCGVPRKSVNYFRDWKEKTQTHNDHGDIITLLPYEKKIGENYNI